MRVASASMARFGVTFPALACGGGGGGGIAGLGLRVLGVDLRASRRQQEEREGRDTEEQTSGGWG